MITIDQFKCKVGKYDLTCQLNGTNLKFRVECLSELLIYESTYSNDTLPIQYKVLFSSSITKLFNYLKDKPSTKLKFTGNQLIVIFQLMGEHKNLPLHLQKKALNVNDLLATIQKLNQINLELKQKNATLIREKKQLEHENTNLHIVKDNKQAQLKQIIISQANKIQKLQGCLKIKDSKLAQNKTLFQALETAVAKREEEEYDSSSSQQSDDNDDQKKESLPNMTIVKDQFVIVWKEKKDIAFKIQHLNRFPDCLTIKILGKQGENGNQGIKELSDILPRVEQLKNIKILNLYFNNHKFGKGVSLNFWQVLRATIIAHLKIKFVNFVIGPKTWKANQKTLQKEIQQYPKKIVVNTQVRCWK